MNPFSHRLGATVAATLLATAAFSAAASAGCGSCGSRGAVYGSSVMVEPIDMTPRYMVNQGPVYDGPAISVPFLTYSESLSMHSYPYVRGVRGYYARGYGDVYTGGPYAHPMNHHRYGYGHRYYHRQYHHQSRVYGVDGRAVDVPMRPGVSVVRARAEVRHVNPERMDNRGYRDQTRKPRRDQY